MSPADTDPPPVDPDVRDELDRMEDERSLPDADDAVDGSEDDDLPVEGEADEGDEAPTG
jgi:hypothetical protein